MDALIASGTQSISPLAQNYSLTSLWLEPVIVIICGINWLDLIEAFTNPLEFVFGIFKYNLVFFDFISLKYS